VQELVLKRTVRSASILPPAAKVVGGFAFAAMLTIWREDESLEAGL
jgi:hypothetical protein